MRIAATIFNFHRTSPARTGLIAQRSAMVHSEKHPTDLVLRKLLTSQKYALAPVITL